MENFPCRVIEILEKSIQRNGVKPLTNLHLLNIIKLCVKSIDDEEEELRQRLDEVQTEIYLSECGDRD